MKVQTVYFDIPGKKNTKDTIKIAKKRAKELGIKTIILSSSGGYTAKLALNEIRDKTKLIVVGFPDRFPKELKTELESKGHIVLFPSDYVFDHPESAWELLRRFGEGMKRYRCVTFVTLRGGGRMEELHEEHEPEEIHGATPLIEFRTELEGPMWKGNVCKWCRTLYVVKEER